MKRSEKKVKLYRTALLDPPWPERGGGKIKRGADRHYELLNPSQMPQTVLASGVFHFEVHAHCYLWVTNNYLRQGLVLLEQLGFRYVTNVVWPKQRAGLGQYFRGKHELMLFGVRGKGKDPSVYQDTRSLTTVLEGEHVRVHSRKPEQAFELVERRSKGPYLELFGDPALPARPGWERWGRPRKVELAVGA
jgi:N6-adenosine-specific RNA methylase IME4